MHKGQGDREHNENPLGPVGNGIQVEAGRGGGAEVRLAEAGREGEEPTEGRTPRVQ